MKRYIPLLAGILILVFSCASKKSVVVLNVSGGDGSSYEQAVIINETHEGPGSQAEYAWLKMKYPHYQNEGQALVYNEKIPYDVISIVTGRGKALSVYFNIEKFYGKF